MKICVCLGTRPEVIKLFLLIEKLKEKHDVVIVFTGQHKELFDDVKNLIPPVDRQIEFVNNGNLTENYCNIMKQISDVFVSESPDLVIVQGDTTTSYCCAMAAFILKIKVGHVEAGLRTNNIYSPFPEEMNRQLISRIAYYNWCPSELAVTNLKKENVNGKIIFTGNTIVDAIANMKIGVQRQNRIMITLHRRENEKVFKDILKQINIIAIQNPNTDFIFPCHPNPIIKKHASILKSDNIYVVAPMGYEEFVRVFALSIGAITDSGGIQEEAVCLGKKVLVCRQETERPEGIGLGLFRIVGNNVMDNFEWLMTEYNGNYSNPYCNGEGRSCDKIAESINND